MDNMVVSSLLLFQIMLCLIHVPLLSRLVCVFFQIELLPLEKLLSLSTFSVFNTEHRTSYSEAWVSDNEMGAVDLGAQQYSLPNGP